MGMGVCGIPVVTGTTLVNSQNYKIDLRTTECFGIRFTHIAAIWSSDLTLLLCLWLVDYGVF